MIEKNPQPFGQYLKSTLKKLRFAITHPLTLLPALVITGVWILLGIAQAKWVQAGETSPAVLKVLNFFTFAQGGMFGGVIGAIGGIIGKVLFAALLNALILPLFIKGNKPFSHFREGFRNFGRSFAFDGLRALSFFLGGLGIALLFYSVINITQRWEEGLIGLVGAFLAIRGIGRRGGMMTSLLYSLATALSKNKLPSQISITRFMSGMAIGFTVGAGLSLSGLKWAILLSVIALVLALLFFLFGNKPKTAVAAAAIASLLLVPVYAQDAVDEALGRLSGSAADLDKAKADADALLEELEKKQIDLDKVDMNRVEEYNSQIADAESRGDQEEVRRITAERDKYIQGALGIKSGKSGRRSSGGNGGGFRSEVTERMTQPWADEDSYIDSEAAVAAVDAAAGVAALAGAAGAAGGAGPLGGGGPDFPDAPDWEYDPKEREKSDGESEEDSGDDSSDGFGDEPEESEPEEEEPVEDAEETEEGEPAEEELAEDAEETEEGESEEEEPAEEEPSEDAEETEEGEPEEEEQAEDAEETEEGEPEEEEVEETEEEPGEETEEEAGEEEPEEEQKEEEDQEEAEDSEEQKEMKEDEEPEEEPEEEEPAEDTEDAEEAEEVEEKSEEEREPVESEEESQPEEETAGEEEVDDYDEEAERIQREKEQEAINQRYANEFRQDADQFAQRTEEGRIDRELEQERKEEERRQEVEKARLAEEARQERVKETAERYGVETTDKEGNARDIRDVQSDAEKAIKKDVIHDVYKNELAIQQICNEVELECSEKIAKAELVDNVSEGTVNILGECTGPAGKQVKNWHGFLKATAVAYKEAECDGRNVFVGTVGGMVEGGFTVAQNEIGDAVKGFGGTKLQQTVLAGSGTIFFEGTKTLVHETVRGTDLGEAVEKAQTSMARKTGNVIYTSLTGNALDKIPGLAGTKFGASEETQKALEEVTKGTNALIGETYDRAHDNMTVADKNISEHLTDDFNNWKNSIAEKLF